MFQNASKEEQRDTLQDTWDFLFAKKVHSAATHKMPVDFDDEAARAVLDARRKDQMSVSKAFRASFPEGEEPTNKDGRSPSPPRTDETHAAKKMLQLGLVPSQRGNGAALRGRRARPRPQPPRSARPRRPKASSEA